MECLQYQKKAESDLVDADASIPEEEASDLVDADASIPEEEVEITETDEEQTSLLVAPNRAR